MLHPTSPVLSTFPATHPLISPFTSPTPNIFISSNAEQRSLPPLSPMPEGFKPRPIPSPLLLPGHTGSLFLQEDGVSDLLGGLRFDNCDRDKTILSHAQSIANLETQACPSEKLI
jgi:hypothetical protein